MKSKLKWKASLINKREVVVSLTEEDVEFLVTNTSYSLEEISDWHRQFIAQCPQVGYIYHEGNYFDKVKPDQKYVSPAFSLGLASCQVSG